MLYFKVANDNGNSEQDMFINDTLVMQPNVFARVYHLPNLDEINKQYVLDHIHNNLIVSIDGCIYYIGSYALKSGKRCRSIGVGGNNTKLESEIVYINTLAHIAGEAVSIVAKESHIDSLELVNVQVDMATALPVSYYSQKNANLFSKKFIAKKHLVSVYIGNKTINVNVKFDFVKVIPEGVTASFALENMQELFDGQEYSMEAIKNSKILHIAIGEGTTEFPITEKCIFKPDFITGTNNGNGHAIDRVIEDFKKHFGLSNFNRQDYSNVLRDKSHKYHETAMEYIEFSLEEEAEDILHMAEHVIQEAKNDVDFVCVYGGGSILMRNALEQRLQNYCEKAKINLLYINESQAVILEALGLQVFINSKLFQMIKNKQGRSVNEGDGEINKS